MNYGLSVMSVGFGEFYRVTCCFGYGLGAFGLGSIGLRVVLVTSYGLVISYELWVMGYECSGCDAFGIFAIS